MELANNFFVFIVDQLSRLKTLNNTHNVLVNYKNNQKKLRHLSLITVLSLNSSFTRFRDEQMVIWDY